MNFVINVYNELGVKINNKLPDSFVYGNCKVNPIYDYSPDGTPYEQLYDFDPVYDMRKNVGIKHRLRVIVRNANNTIRRFYACLCR